MPVLADIPFYYIGGEMSDEKYVCPAHFAQLIRQWQLLPFDKLEQGDREWARDREKWVKEKRSEADFDHNVEDMRRITSLLIDWLNYLQRRSGKK